MAEDSHHVDVIRRLTSIRTTTRTLTHEYLRGQVGEAGPDQPDDEADDHADDRRAGPRRGCPATSGQATGPRRGVDSVTAADVG